MEREIRATAPGPGPDATRRAYLELLKLSLCDLTGMGTTSVEGLPQGHVASRELSGDQLRLRAEGRDWPLHGLTMSGLRRLDDLQACVESIVGDDVPGDLIEAGSWRGGASMLTRATLDSLGDETRTVWVADSFQGFPVTDRQAAKEYPRTLEPYLAVFDFLAAPLEQVQAAFARFGLDHGIRFVPGFFEDTLPALTGTRWSLVRIDADTYDSTLLALRCLYPGLAVGGYLIVDDYWALEECRAAVDAFRGEHGIDEPIEPVDWTCVRWRRRAETAIEPLSRPAGHASRAVASAPRRADRRVPTARELELAAEVTELREQIADLERDLAQARDYERRLAEVTASTSWRVTRPLRELGLRIKSRG